MTQAAEDILERAVSMEEQALAIFRETDGRDQALRGNLVLTLPYDFAATVLVPVLGHFRRRYPAIELELSTSLDLVDLNARHADIALRMTEKPPDHLVGRRVLPLCFGVYAHRDYLKACGSPEIIGYRRDRQVPTWARDAFPSAQLSFRADSAVTVRSAISNRLGIGRMPCFYGDAAPELVRLDVGESQSSWGIWVLHHADLRATARVRACRDFLYEVLEEKKGLIVGRDSTFARIPPSWRR
jgi:DNA-binding transcriptional LysR family regulator